MIETANDTVVDWVSTAFEMHREAATLLAAEAPASPIGVILVWHPGVRRRRLQLPVAGDLLKSRTRIGPIAR